MEQPDITVEKIQEPQLIRENLQGIHLITQLFPHVWQIDGARVYKVILAKIGEDITEKR
jgi:hypothetical protein